MVGPRQPLQFEDPVLERRWQESRHVFGFGGVSLRTVTLSFFGMAATYLLLVLAQSTVLVDPVEDERMADARWGFSGFTRFLFFGLPYFILSIGLLLFYIVSTLRVVGSASMRGKGKGTEKGDGAEKGTETGTEKGDAGDAGGEEKDYIQRFRTMQLSWKAFAVVYPPLHVLYLALSGSVVVQREFPSLVAVVGSVLVVLATVAGFGPCALGMVLAALAGVIGTALEWPSPAASGTVIGCFILALAIAIVIATAFFGERAERKGFEALVNVLESRSRAARIFSSVMPTHVARVIAEGTTQLDTEEEAVSRAAAQIDDVDNATVVFCAIDVADHVRAEMDVRAFTVFLTRLFRVMDGALETARSHPVSIRALGKRARARARALGSAARVDISKIENQPNLYIAAAGLNGSPGSAHASWGCVLAVILDEAVAAFVESADGVSPGDVLLRIGVASGPIAGGLNGGSSSGALVYSAYGDTVNTAARCAWNKWDDGSGGADPASSSIVPSTASGTVQVSKGTLDKLRVELSSHMFSFRVKSKVFLKGKTAPESVGRIDAFSRIALELIEMSKNSASDHLKAAGFHTGRSMRSSFATPSAVSSNGGDDEPAFADDPVYAALARNTAQRRPIAPLPRQSSRYRPVPGMFPPSSSPLASKPVLAGISRSAGTRSRASSRRSTHEVVLPSIREENSSSEEDEPRRPIRGPPRDRRRAPPRSSTYSAKDLKARSSGPHTGNPRLKARSSRFSTTASPATTAAAAAAAASAAASVASDAALSHGSANSRRRLPSTSTLSTIDIPGTLSMSTRTHLDPPKRPADVPRVSLEGFAARDAGDAQQQSAGAGGGELQLLQQNHHHQQQQQQQQQQDEGNVFTDGGGLDSGLEGDRDEILAEILASGREMLTSATKRRPENADEAKECRVFEEVHSNLYTRIVAGSIAGCIVLIAISAMVAITETPGVDEVAGFYVFVSFLAIALCIGVAPFLPVRSGVRDAIIVASVMSGYAVRIYLQLEILRDVAVSSFYNLCVLLIVHALNERGGTACIILLVLTLSSFTVFEVYSILSYTDVVPTEEDNFGAATLTRGLGYSAILACIGYLGVLRRRAATVQLRSRFILTRRAETEGLRFVRLISHALPSWSVDAFIQREDAVAEPICKTFPDAIVFQADIVSFTKLSEISSPVEVLKMLHNVQGAFDDAAARHGVHKLGTVGDAYIAYTESASKEEITAILNFAQDALEALSNLPKFHGEHTIRVRCGAATGEMDTGVLGDSMPMFRGWGNAIDEASECESSGTPDHLTVTSGLYAAILTTGQRCPDFVKCPFVDEYEQNSDEELDAHVLADYNNMPSQANPGEIL